MVPYAAACILWNFGATLHIAITKNSIGQEFLHHNTNPNVPSIQRRFNPLVFSSMLIPTTGWFCVILIFLSFRILDPYRQADIFFHATNLIVSVLFPVIFTSTNTSFQVHVKRTVANLLPNSNRIYDIPM